MQLDSIIQKWMQQFYSLLKFLKIKMIKFSLFDLLHVITSKIYCFLEFLFIPITQIALYFLSLTRLSIIFLMALKMIKITGKTGRFTETT